MKNYTCNTHKIITLVQEIGGLPGTKCSGSPTLRCSSYLIHPAFMYPDWSDWNFLTQWTSMHLTFLMLVLSLYIIFPFSALVILKLHKINSMPDSFNYFSLKSFSVMEIGFKTLGFPIMTYKGFPIMTYKDVEYCFWKQSFNQHMSPILFQGWRVGNRTYENGQTR